MITIREEGPHDAPILRRVHELAFGQPAEADIVDRLRARCDELVSLVATDGEAIVGHILFSPATVESADGEPIRGMGLAPMAVMPDRQRQGIGSALVERGLALLEERGCPFVIVLGHTAYYPRFGFAPASRCGLACPWEGVPDDVFMARVLDEDRMAGVTGVARYRDEFDEAV